MGQGGNFGDGNHNGPGNDLPDDDGPGDHPDNEDPYADGNQPNLTDAHHVQNQGDGSQAKVQEPDQTPDLSSSISAQLQRLSIDFHQWLKESYHCVRDQFSREKVKSCESGFGVKI